MHSYGNFQWNEDYPKAEHLMNDIDNGSLYVYEIEGMIAGIVCINKEEPEEYKNANWSMSKEAYIIHRLAVNKNYLGHGVGSELLNYTDVICAKNNISYIKTDTNALNIKAQGLLIKCGYTFVGETSLTGYRGLFYCYEKLL
jgi:GNAT superfamily N-acetyltransferase